jgi:hypothetical protein
VQTAVTAPHHSRRLLAAKRPPERSREPCSERPARSPIAHRAMVSAYRRQHIILTG